MKKLMLAALVVASVSAPAMAYQSKDVIFRAGAAYTTPNIDSNNFTMSGGGSSTFLLDDADAETAFGMSVAWMVTPKVAVELQTASTYTFEMLKNNGDAFSNVDLSMPSVNIQYYFLDGESKLQPYFGVGANYAHFGKEESLDANITQVNFENELGLNAQIGLDYMFNENFGLNTSLAYMDVASDTSYTEGGNVYTEKVVFDPIVFSIGGVYSF